MASRIIACALSVAGLLTITTTASADDFLGDTYPSLETWDNQGTYEVIVPNGVGGFESFDNQGVYTVTETPRTMGAEPLRFPAQDIDRAVTDQFLFPHERYDHP
jgi:hypothetical protein